MSRERLQYWIVSLLSIASSAGGVIYAVMVSGDKADGLRGGAVATAIALAYLFLNRSYGMRLFSALTDKLPELKRLIDSLPSEDEAKKDEQPPPVPTPSELKKQIDTLVRAIKMDSRAQQTQNKFIAFATLVAAVVSGFGDCIVARFL